MLTTLNKLNIGDKFWFTNIPYLIIDLDYKNLTPTTDFSNVKFVLNLNTYKIVGLDSSIKVIQDKDNFYV